MLRTLSLRCFRVYQNSHFNFSPGVNLIFGENAKGKTSLLEALHFLITGRSFRAAQSSDMISKGSTGFFLEASFIKHEIEQQISVIVEEKTRRVTYNTTVYSTLSSLLGILQGVVLHPDDAALVKGSPILRRHFLDVQMGQVDPLYVHFLTRYNRAMQQRNYLLRSRALTTIESWEHEMANAAAYIVMQRRKAVEDLLHEGKRLYQLFSGESMELNLLYKTAAPPNADKLYYIEQFHKHRKREMELGTTLLGPHKDELLILLGDKEARYFASEGQQRSCVAALRFAEWERLRAVSSEEPIMLLDDVGISLDQSRRKRLFQHLNTLGQVFLTSTDDLRQEFEQIQVHQLF